MSVVIVDFENRTVYADRKTSRTTYSRLTLPSIKTSKLRAIESRNAVVTGTGCKDTIDSAFVSLHSDGNIRFPKAVPGTNIILLQWCETGLTATVYRSKKNWLGRCVWEQEVFNQSTGHWVSGSGGTYALGAIRAGVPIQKAIAASSSCCPYVGYGYDYTRINEDSLDIYTYVEPSKRKEQA